MINEPIVFLGAGNMARALIAGLRQQGVPGHQIQVHAPHPERRDALQRDFGIRSLPAEPVDLPAGASVLYAAKPKQVPAVLDAWAGPLQAAQALLISVAAGVRLQSLQERVGAAVTIVRAMPNTPAQIGAGASTLCTATGTSETARARAEAILAATGLALWVPDEDSLDVSTALAGSGPAYVLLLLEALEDAAVAHGLYRDQARRLAIQTVLGTAQMAQGSAHSPTELRHQVTSPGGTTAAAVGVWEEGLRPLARRALDAAIARSRALAAGQL